MTALLFEHASTHCPLAGWSGSPLSGKLPPPSLPQSRLPAHVQYACALHQLTSTGELSLGGVPASGMKLAFHVHTAEGGGGLAAARKLRYWSFVTSVTSMHTEPTRTIAG